MAVDWGDGEYARTAARLEPVARRLVEALRVGPGDRVLDVGCGTGNAALAAARAGAAVTGVDPSQALLDQARRRADTAGVSLTLVAGTVRDAPPDPPFDVVMSCFAVIFDPHPDQAVPAMVARTAPGGRVGLTAWRRGDAIGRLGELLWSALPDAAPASRGWEDPLWIHDLLTAAGARDVSITDGDLVVRHRSPEAYQAEVGAHHPAWRWARRRMDEATWDDVQRLGVALLRDANEDPAAFAVTTGYRLVTARVP